MYFSYKAHYVELNDGNRYIGCYTLSTGKIDLKAAFMQVEESQSEVKLCATRGNKSMLFAVCHCSEGQLIKANTLYGIDPDFQTCEQLAECPAFSKDPLVTAINHRLYLVNGAAEDFS